MYHFQLLSDILKNKATTAIELAFGKELENFPELLHADIEQSTQAHFGDYQCNSALKIGKALKKNPREVATALVACLDKQFSANLSLISKVEIAGPGFINIYLDPHFLSDRLNHILHSTHLGVPVSSVKHRVVVEFSSPNIAKELHVGHLRSTIIGDCLARVFEFLGKEVIRLNHVGDWGTQFGMLIAFMQEVAPDVLSGEREATLTDLMHWYKESKKQFDADEEFKKRAHQCVVLLQNKEPKIYKGWEIICAISRQAYQQIYQLLDIKITERGESFYNPYLNELIEDLESKGLITISDNAKCIFLDGFYTRENTPLPMIVQKSDKGFNYDTTDLAAMRYRVEKDKADRIIVVTDAGQVLHFQMLEKAAIRAGYLDPEKVRFDHVPFGVVLGPDGKKFKTRTGETEKLIDLLQTAIDKAREILESRLEGASPDEIARYAEHLGIGAVKYADLSCHRIKDYVFSYDRMLKFEGNTAAFMLYAFVRIEGIKRKVDKGIAELIKTGKIKLSHPTEIALGTHLLQFGESLQLVQQELLPNRLTDYLYLLAEKFHAFFRDCRVEGDADEESRLLLCEVTSRILKKGLALLGLETLPKM